MNKNIQEISPEQWTQIALNMLPGGCDRFYDARGIGYADVFLFRDEYQHVFLCLETSIELAIQDDVIHREIISVDNNPELFDIYDFENQCLIEGETQQILNYFHVGATLDYENVVESVKTHD